MKPYWVWEIQAIGRRYNPSMESSPHFLGSSPSSSCKSSKIILKKTYSWSNLDNPKFLNLKNRTLKTDIFTWSENRPDDGRCIENNYLNILITPFVVGSPEKIKAIFLKYQELLSVQKVNKWLFEYYRIRGE